MTATCCLFLAGKVEETPKKCKGVLKLFLNEKGLVGEKEVKRSFHLDIENSKLRLILVNQLYLRFDQRGKTNPLGSPLPTIRIGPDAGERRSDGNGASSSANN